MSFKQQQQDNDDVFTNRLRRDDGDFKPMVLRKANPQHVEKVVKPVAPKAVANVGGNLMKKVYDKEDPNAEPELVQVKMDPEFGKKMAATRVAKGLTQKQVAVATSIPVGTISDYERGVGGKNIAHINKIKRFLGF